MTDTEDDRDRQRGTKDPATEAPADAFGALGHEIRLDVLQALASATRPGYGGQAVRFSELRDRVGVDDAGQLNYHLNELLGQFVRRTEEGYRLRYAGWRVVRAIRAGTYHETPQRSFDAPGDCYACGADALQAQASDEWIGIRCTDCGALHTAHPLPPWTLQDRQPDAILRTLDANIRHRAALVADGFCPECWGETRVQIREDVPDAWDISVIPQFRCTHCTFWLHTPFGLLALDHPTVTAFLTEHGTDPGERPYWTLPLVVDPSHLTVESRDPWRVCLTTTIDSQRLRVTFDGDATISDVTIE